MFKKTNYEEYNLYLNNNLFKLEFRKSIYYILQNR